MYSIGHLSHITPAFRRFRLHYIDCNKMVKILLTLLYRRIHSDRQKTAARRYSMRFITAAVLLLCACPSPAVVEAYEFRSPQMEADYKQLISELRCLVCQNQNLSDSNADLARDLRRQAHELLMKGNTPEQVADYMVARYGDFVLYRPRLQSNTLLLWLGPFILLALVIVMVVLKVAKKQPLAQPAEDTMALAKQLLSEPRKK